MEAQYLDVVKRYSRGEPGKRGCDSLAKLFGQAVVAMEETHDGMKDILGDLFQGGITYGEAGQFFTPENVGRMMAQMMVSDVPEEVQHQPKRVCDPACGSGRLLLAVAEIQRHWIFVGQDIDLRCVRMTAINLALRNLYGYVIWGNSLADERRLVYRTGFNLAGFLCEVPVGECPEPIQQLAMNANREAESPLGSNALSSFDSDVMSVERIASPKTQLRLF